jgi:hypothetical protein
MPQLKTVFFEEFADKALSLYSSTIENRWNNDDTKRLIDFMLNGIDVDGLPMHVHYDNNLVSDETLDSISQSRDYDSAIILALSVAASFPLQWWTIPRDHDQASKSLGIMCRIRDPRIQGGMHSVSEKVS